MQDQSATVADVMPRVMDNYLTFWRVTAGYYDGAVEEADGIVMVSTGLPSPFFNPAAIVRWPADPRSAVERVRRFGERHGCQPMLATWGEIAARFEPVARQLGLVDDGATPEMLLFPPDQQPVATVAGLSIEPVNTPAQQRAFADVVAATYALPRELATGFEAPAVLNTPGLFCYVGSKDGRPVATAVLLVTGDVAGVHVVGTLPEYRRQGIGAAMTQRCIDDGWRSGCTVSALQSSSSGFPVYQRMGYRHVFDIQGWRFA